MKEGGLARPAITADELLKIHESDPAVENDFHGGVMLQEDRDGNGEWLVSY
jgi:hypothetical protein